MSKFTADVHLCTCNNCEKIITDENPQIGAKVFKVNFSLITAMTKQSDDSGVFWGCPYCKTDFFLTDEVDEMKAKQLGIIE